jgi:hypothetical protein
VASWLPKVRAPLARKAIARNRNRTSFSAAANATDSLRGWRVPPDPTTGLHGTPAGTRIEVYKREVSDRQTRALRRLRTPELSSLAVRPRRHRRRGQSPSKRSPFPAGQVCDPREATDCLLVEIECRAVAKPILATYIERVDLSGATTSFWPGRFSLDTYTALSRDDGATWKRMNLSRMADLSSFDLGSGEPFPGTCRTPALKVIDNKILTVWTSTYCRGGRPRYAIVNCDLSDDPDCIDEYVPCRQSGGDLRRHPLRQPDHSTTLR